MNKNSSTQSSSSTSNIVNISPSVNLRAKLDEYKTKCEDISLCTLNNAFKKNNELQAATNKLIDDLGNNHKNYYHQYSDLVERISLNSFTILEEVRKFSGTPTLTFKELIDQSVAMRFNWIKEDSINEIEKFLNFEEEYDPIAVSTDVSEQNEQNFISHLKNAKCNKLLIEANNDTIVVDQSLFGTIQPLGWDIAIINEDK